MNFAIAFVTACHTDTYLPFHLYIKNLSYPFECFLNTENRKKLKTNSWKTVPKSKYKTKKSDTNKTYISEALLGVLGIRYIYPKYFSYKVLVNIDFWV